MYQTIGELISPDRLLLMLTLFVFAGVWRRYREFRRPTLWILACLGMWLVTSLPIVAHFAAKALEAPYRPLAARPAQATAIVVLAGCAFPRDEGRLEPVLCPDSMYRCLAAAELYHRGAPCPVIVSGGIVAPEDDMPALAVTMREFLVRLGVPSSDIIVEDRSTTTYENAAECRRILAERRIDCVALVTDGVHMRRAQQCFQTAGVAVVPAPCSLHGAWEWSVGQFLPDPYATAGVQDAAHEALGMAWYRMLGRIK